MAEESKPELALLVDGDQVGAQLVPARLALLEKDWSVTARVCVRNWRSSKDQAAWDTVARDCRMECIQHAPETRGKNATDIELTVRAMDLLHGAHYRAFCILSGDSDFRPLARRLQRGGARVMLETLTPPESTNAPPSGAPATTAPKPPAPKASAKAVPKPTAKAEAAKVTVKLAPKTATKPAAPDKPNAPAKPSPDAAAFARVVGKAHDDCVKDGKAKDGAVPLVLLAGRIPANQRKEAFGYSNSRPLRVVVASLPNFQVVRADNNQPAVKRRSGA